MCLLSIIGDIVVNILINFKSERTKTNRNNSQDSSCDLVLWRKLNSIEIANCSSKLSFTYRLIRIQIKHYAVSFSSKNTCIKITYHRHDRCNGYTYIVQDTNVQCCFIDNRYIVKSFSFLLFGNRFAYKLNCIFTCRSFLIKHIQESAYVFIIYIHVSSAFNFLGLSCLQIHYNVPDCIPCVQKLLSRLTQKLHYKNIIIQHFLQKLSLHAPDFNIPLKYHSIRVASMWTDFEDTFF